MTKFTYDYIVKYLIHHEPIFKHTVHNQRHIHTSYDTVEGEENDDTEYD
jgi:hypothetical protein